MDAVKSYSKLGRLTALGFAGFTCSFSISCAMI